MKGDLGAALFDINKASEVDPQNGNLIVERGVLLLLTGKEPEARAQFEILLQSDRQLWQKRIDDRIAAVRNQAPPK